jgi:hypothetical protein
MKKGGSFDPPFSVTFFVFSCVSYLLGNDANTTADTAGSATAAEPAEASKDATDEGAGAIKDTADDAARQRKNAAHVETATAAVTAAEAEQTSAAVTGRAGARHRRAIRATVRQTGAIGAFIWLGLDGRVANPHFIRRTRTASIVSTAVTEDERMASIGDHTKSKNHNKT